MLCYNFVADSFYIMKLCSSLIVLYCRIRPKDDRSRHFDPHFEEVRGGLEPWWIKFGLSLKFGLSERLSERLIQKVKSPSIDVAVLLKRITRIFQILDIADTKWQIDHVTKHRPKDIKQCRDLPDKYPD